MSEYICANEGIDKHLSREPKRAADHWAKFQKLLKADEVFSGMAKYLRRFTHGVAPFAQFVSGSPGLYLKLTALQIQKHARGARANDTSAIRRAIPSAFEEVVLPSGIISGLTSTDFMRADGRHINYNSLCTTRLLINIEHRDKFDRNPKE